MGEKIAIVDRAGQPPPHAEGAKFSSFTGCSAGVGLFHSQTVFARALAEILFKSVSRF